MKAGRELDLLVAEKVMGLRYVEESDQLYDDTTLLNGQPYSYSTDLKPYSTDIAAAREVVEKMQTTDHPYLELLYSLLDDYICTFFDMDSKGKLARGDTASHVICLAALKAKGVGITVSDEDTRREKAIRYQHTEHHTQICHLCEKAESEIIYTRPKVEGHDKMFGLGLETPRESITRAIAEWRKNGKQ